MDDSYIQYVRSYSWLMVQCYILVSYIVLIKPKHLELNYYERVSLEPIVINIHIYLWTAIGVPQNQILQRLRTFMWLCAPHLIWPELIPAGLVHELEMENLWLQVTFPCTHVLTLIKWFCASQPSMCCAYLYLSIYRFIIILFKYLVDHYLLI